MRDFHNPFFGKFSKENFFIQNAGKNRLFVDVFLDGIRAAGGNREVTHYFGLVDQRRGCVTTRNPICLQGHVVQPFNMDEHSNASFPIGFPHPSINASFPTSIRLTADIIQLQERRSKHGHFTASVYVHTVD